MTLEEIMARLQEIQEAQNAPEGHVVGFLGELDAETMNLLLEHLQYGPIV